MYKIIFSLPVVLLLLNFQIFQSYEHSFTMDDSIYFISLVKQAQLELDLAIDNFPSNITVAIEHSDNAARLINDAYYVDDDVVDDQDFINRYNKDVHSTNTTTHALVISTLIDKLLDNYGNSLGLNFDLTNMSNLLVFVNSSELKNTVQNGTFQSGDKKSNSEINISDRDYKLLLSPIGNFIRYSDYLVAKELSQEIDRIFYLYLKSFEGLNKKNLNDVMELEKNLAQLNVMIKNKSPPAELMKLVHLKIHPMMQTIYNLKVTIPST